MKGILTALAACAAVAGCAHYDKKLDTWVGVPVGHLVQQWGPPQSTYDLPDGSKVLQYGEHGTLALPGISYATPQTTYQNGTVNAYGSGGYATANYQGTTTTYTQTTSPTTYIQTSCTTNFTVNPSGYVASWSYNGNNCR